MDTQNITRSLLRELRKPENQKLFEMTRKRNTAFANHSTPFSILAVLDDRSTDNYAGKDALTRSLISEQQRATNSLWSAILIAAYLPMLGRLRNKITGNPLLPDDLDQVVITTFLQVVQEFPLFKLRNYTCLRLRQRTQRLVFQQLNEERLVRNLRDPRPIEEIPESSFEQCSIWRQLSRSGKSEERDVEVEVALLLDYVGDAIAPDKLELIIATTIKGESLRDFIKRSNLGPLDSLNDREFQRLKRQRSRTLAIIRKILTKILSPNKEDCAL